VRQRRLTCSRDSRVLSGNDRPQRVDTCLLIGEPELFGGSPKSEGEGGDCDSTDEREKTIVRTNQAKAAQAGAEYKDSDDAAVLIETFGALVMIWTVYTIAERLRQAKFGEHKPDGRRDSSGHD